MFDKSAKVFSLHYLRLYVVGIITLYLIVRFTGGSIMVHDLLINEGLLPVPSSAKDIQLGCFWNQEGLKRMRESSVVVVGMLGASRFDENPGELKPVLEQVSTLAGLFSKSAVMLNVGNVAPAVESTLE
jgi:hypothetical protein